MRYGCCVGLPSQPSSGAGFEIVEGLARIGFDYVELPLFQAAGLPEAEFTALRENLARTGLRSEALNVFFPRSVRLTGEEVDWGQVKEYAQIAISRAAQIGARVLVLGSAGSRNVPEGFPRQRAWEQLFQALRLLDPIAGQHGIVIAIEPLNHAESNILNTVEEALALARQVDRASVQVLVDYYHFSFEHEPLEHVLQAGGAIRHVHIAKAEGRTYPTQVEPGYPPFFEALKAIGYDGRVSIEAGSQDILADAEKALVVMSRLGG